jgi:SAM-dependent methyltransferase
MLETAGKRCAICGGTLGRELLTIRHPDRFELHVGIRKEGYMRSWVECDHCGAATNVQSPENLSKLAELAAGYYEVDFKGSSIEAKYQKVMGLARTESDNAQRVERILSFLRSWSEYGLAVSTPSRRALDIGAGTGVFLSRFLQQVAGLNPAWSAVAVEPDPVAAAHLRRLELFAVVEKIYSPELGLEQFQLCTLNKVVEHVPDPLRLLTEVAGTLAADGVIYVEVPDRLTLFHRPSTDNVVGALHHHLYSMEALVTLCNASNLVPLRTERHFEPSGKISLSVFAVSRAAASRLASGRAIIPGHRHDSDRSVL